jgi:hypothetical protein
MKKKHVMWGLLALLWTAGIKAQNAQETQRLAELSKKLEGTYQVQVIDSRQYFSLPTTYFDSIRVIRHESDVKYIWFQPNMRIMVPPYKEIRKAGFAPLPRVAYITSSEK